MNVDKRSSGRFSASARLLAAFAILIGSLCAGPARAQAPADPLPDQTTEDAAESPLDAGGFHFNDHDTTPFGPAYADIWLKQENFLVCKPPVRRNFSYALCFFSGPAVGTPVPTDGSPSINPPLPCTLSADGTSANCTCYGLTTDQYPPYVPYFVDINGILNLDLYLRTIGVCGHGGENCSPEPIGESPSGNKAPICRAANINAVIPSADMISVFSPVKNADYATGASSNQTSCPAGKYAGCMTAPCYHTGKKDSAGNELVECKCPVFDGPFELGQAGVPCDANALTPPSTDASTAGAQPLPLSYVWSAAHNPIVNHAPIDPPPTGCLPDMAGDKGCPLYSSTTTYPVAAGSPLCHDVCKSYRTGIRLPGIQVGYTCDATLCTTVGIGQSTPPPPNPLGKATLLKKACGGLAEQSGLPAILALEQRDQCSCCASQVCGCATPDANTQAEISQLNAQQQTLAITPQCEINGTLCGASQMPALEAAVLPSSASVQVGNPATAFATITNAGPGDASTCSIAPATTILASFIYQTTNPATNALTGTPNTPVDIAQGASQSFVIAFTPSAAFSPTVVQLTFACANAGPAPQIIGVDTLNLSASTTPVPNIVALAASGDPGYVDIPGTTGTGDFAVATVNLGADATVTAAANTGSANLPVTLTLCETNPTSGACLAGPSATVTTDIPPNATPTFGIFVTGSGTVPNSPGVNRVFVTFTDANGVLRGETSVAVRSQ